MARLLELEALAVLFRPQETRSCHPMPLNIDDKNQVPESYIPMSLIWSADRQRAWPADWLYRVTASSLETRSKHYINTVEYT
jgi:hypothetical protein